MNHIKEDRLVSIIVPIYNSEKHISKCIKSILSQTYKNFELILINDGSTDNSKKIIEQFKKKDDRIKVINKENSGVADTRNLGIKNANGFYIMFIDNDDYIEQNYIETFINANKDENYDIVLGGYKRVNVDNKILFEEKLKDTYWSKYIITAPWAKLYKSEFLKKTNAEFFSYYIGEDIYFNIVLYSYNPKCKIIQYNGYNWFFNTKSVSNTSQKGFNKKINILYLLNNIRKNIKFEDDYNLYFYYRYCIWYLLFSGRNSNPKDFMNQYYKIKKWFKENNIKVNISPLSYKLKGESFKNRFVVFTFKVMDKLKLIKLFSKIYCKG